MSNGIVRNPSGYHSSGKTYKEKAVNFATFIKDFGWTGEWYEDEETQDVTLIAIRNGERIEAFWNTPIPWPEIWYSYAGNKTKLRNISHAAKYAQAKPSPPSPRKRSRVLDPYRPPKDSRTATLAARNGAAYEADSPPNGLEPVPELTNLIKPPIARCELDIDWTALVTTLPFDRESTPEEIKAVIKTHINPTILWVNRLTGRVEQDIIKTWSRYLNVTTNKEGKTILHFPGRHYFHAVYIDSVIGVT